MCVLRQLANCFFADINKEIARFDWFCDVLLFNSDLINSFTQIFLGICVVYITLLIHKFCLRTAINVFDTEQKCSQNQVIVNLG